MPKTGSTNFQLALSHYSDLSLVRGAHLARNISSHITADDFLDIFPSSIVGKPFTFSIMRSPFSWAVSAFNYGSRKELNSPAHKKSRRGGATSDWSFDDFLSFWEENKEFKKTQSDFLFRNDGSPLDAILRLEHIKNDICSIKNILPNDFDVNACFEKQYNKSVNVKMTVSNLTKSQKLRLKVLLARDLALYDSLPHNDVLRNTSNIQKCSNECSVKFTKWLDKNRPIIAAEGYYSVGMNLYRDGENRNALAMFENARHLDPEILGFSGIILLLYRVLGLTSQWEAEHRVLNDSRHIHPKVVEFSRFIIPIYKVLGLTKRVTELENHSNSLISCALIGYETAYWKYRNGDFQAAYDLILNVLDFSVGRPKDFLLLADCATHLSSEEVKFVATKLIDAKIRFANNETFSNMLNKIDGRYK